MAVVMKDWERTYAGTKPVMGTPDDTDAGHRDAENTARLHWARLALRWYEDGHVHELTFLKHLREALR